MDDRSVLRDRWIWRAILLGLVLRALPMLLWGWAGDDCTRDECIFKIAARPILEGHGLGLAPKGWLPAPGFPYLLATCAWLTGQFESVKWVHWALSVPTTLLFAATALRLGGPRASRWMAWFFALHPTFIFYVGTMWTETAYTALLALTCWSLLWARDGSASRAALTGVALGLCVLNRGVATWLAPIVLMSLIAPELLNSGRDGWVAAVRTRARHGLGFVLALVLTVAPYSIAASARWGGFVISDATLGHVIALGNDRFPPVTFDYMIGQLTGPLFARTQASGRHDCPHTDGPVDYDHCEVNRALRWIADHPREFAARIPVRLAQLFNPHTFLTRHLRWGFWPGLPWELKELLVAWQAMHSYAVVVLGTIAAWARGRGPYTLFAAGTIIYYVAIISALYGLSRFRLPVEPLWMLWLAVAAADPPAARAGLLSSRWRMVGAALSGGVLAGLMSVYLWTGYPGL